MSYRTVLSAAAPVYTQNPLSVAKSECASVASSENSYAEPEFFQIKPEAVLKQAMRLVANPEYFDNWYVITQLYYQNPGAWICKGHIHQTSPADQPHLSVSYLSTNLPRVIHSYYHIYGFIKNTFIITHITRQNKDGTIVKVAEFGAATY